MELGHSTLQIIAPRSVVAMAYRCPRPLAPGPEWNPPLEPSNRPRAYRWPRRPVAT